MRTRVHPLAYGVVTAFLAAVLTGPSSGQLSRQVRIPLDKNRTYVGPPRADLTAKLTGPEGAAVYPGFGLSQDYRISISNKGTKDARNFNVDMVLVQDLSQPKKSHLLSRQAVGLLKKGAALEIKPGKGFVIPEKGIFGKRYLAVLADPANTVPEIDENNNGAALSLLIQIRITDAFAVGGSSYGMEAVGLGFGSTEDNKVVYIDGSLPMKSCLWSPNRICFYTVTTMQTGVNRTVTLRIGSQTISNAFTFFMRSFFCEIGPDEGHAGDLVWVVGNGFGANQGNRILKLGSATVTVIDSWGDKHIDFRIPSGLAPGVYTCSLWENGIDISASWKGCDFTILQP